jgi:photosystem II stability/assembly factor-like uncharacterized protein
VAVIVAVAAAAATLASASAAPSRTAGANVVLAELVSPSFGLVATTSRSRTRLLVTAGRMWRDITPPRALFQPEDLVFLDRKHGWFVTNDCVAGRALVHRTSDGGRTWKAAQVRSTNCAAGSSLSLSFADRTHGWLVRTFLNGPGSELSRTVDGGRAWRRAHDLPLLGRIAFRTARQGWLARSAVRYTANLFVTSDGGATWRRRLLPPPPRWRRARLLPDVPTFFGVRGVLPVALHGGHGSGVAFYLTSDGGRTWRVRRVQPVRFSTLIGQSAFPRYVPTAVASPREWWVVSGIAVPRVLVTSDAGRHWLASRPPAPEGSSVWQIDAADTTVAWLTLRTRRGRTLLLATADGGRSWRRVAVPG